jgi:hypothetical protein
MQEDKLSKWLAEQLRMQQEENRLPYDLGAWEAFESKRASTARKKSPYWISGIAAAITVLLVAGGLWLAQEAGSEDPLLTDQIALEEGKAASDIHEPATVAPDTETVAPLETLALNLPETNKKESPVANGQKRRTEVNQASPNAVEERAPNKLDLPATKSVVPDEGSYVRPNPTTVVTPREPNMSEGVAAVEPPAKAEMNASTQQSLVAATEKSEGEIVKQPVVQKAELAEAELPKDPLLDEAEIQEILQNKSFASLAMGVSPGFGASQSSEHATAGTSLGLGVMVDMSVAGKLVMGSGVAVNYLNQASESQAYNYAGISAGSSTVTKTDEISQVQVDIPLYFKYPITRSERISVQAGFSNLITFNQGAAQQETYTRQVAVYDALAANSFRIQSESVSQTQDLGVVNQKFYPFATANFGVNFRLFEAKKTSYEVMPFYNHPLQEFSGYGEKLGMFGASFKVNFGAIQGK